MAIPGHTAFVQRACIAHAGPLAHLAQAVPTRILHACGHALRQSCLAGVRGTQCVYRGPGMRSGACPQAPLQVGVAPAGALRVPLVAVLAPHFHYVLLLVSFGAAMTANTAQQMTAYLTENRVDPAVVKYLVEDCQVESTDDFLGWFAPRKDYEQKVEEVLKAKFRW